MKQTILLCALFVTTFSAISFAKSGMPMINTSSLYFKICGSVIIYCQDSAFYKGHEYDFKFLLTDPVASEKLEMNLKNRMNEVRSQQTRVVGPMKALISLGKESSSIGPGYRSRKTLYIINETEIELILN